LPATRIGLIGCGKQAPKHIGGLRGSPGVEIVLADKDPALAEALARRERLAWVGSADELFADADLNAVDLCTPTQFHAPLIRQALAAGKDFFCEKPLCESAAEARALRDLAAASGRIGMVGYVYRYASVFEQVRTVLAGAAATGASPVLGKLTAALIRIGGRGSASLWKHRRDGSGGAINEMLVHMLDLAIWYFGPIRRIDVLMRELYRPRRIINGVMEDADAEDFVLVRCATKSGVPVVIQADLVTPAFTQLLEVQGENGSLMASIQPEMPQYVFAIDAAGGYGAGRTHLSTGPENMFAAEMTDFVQAVRLRKQPERCSLDDSVLVLEAIEMLREERTKVRSSRFEI
jgi:predicted dehydrogenase